VTSAPSPGSVAAATERIRLRRRRNWIVGGCLAVAVACFGLLGAMGAYSNPHTITHSVSRPRCLSASQTWNDIGYSGCVQFTVGYVYTSDSGQNYLDQYSDYSSGFAVWIPSNYSFGADLVSRYDGATIDVTGTISSYDGAPQIEVTDPSQLREVQ
jgi:hypothetical protein